MFAFKKKGLIFSANGRLSWMYSHAQCPFPLVLGDIVRVYFATREAYAGKQSRAHGGYVDLDRNNLTKILDISNSPIVSLGGLGEFDEFGSMPGSVVFFKNRFILYYCGWSRGTSVPYDWAIGMAESIDAKHFIRLGKGPVLGATVSEPYLQACPVVYQFSPGELEMYYLSGVNWISDHGKPESQYLLMRATSLDGVNWVRDGLPIIPISVEHESQTSAAVFEHLGRYHMFFSYRYGLGFRTNPSRGYRIGYAWSSDRVIWHRDDSKARLSCSDQGWDSLMVGYPSILKIDGRYFIFYCGNDFGKAGFGIAEIDVKQ
jgi:hypothetical protein